MKSRGRMFQTKEKQVLWPWSRKNAWLFWELMKSHCCQCGMSKGAGEERKEKSLERRGRPRPWKAL